MSSPDFFGERRRRILMQGADTGLVEASLAWLRMANAYGYSYNFEFMGRPLIQYPQDIVQMQQLILAANPEVVVETGIAHGGSIVMSAAMLCLLDIADGVDPRESSRRVIAVDIDIRSHNRLALDNHPMRFKIELIEGSSIDPEIVTKVRERVAGARKVLVSLDSNHTHEHVMRELDAFASLVSIGSYCVVFDTVIEDLPHDSFPDRPWGVSNNPKTAVREWLSSHPEFEIDYSIDQTLLISVAPCGYLRRTR